MGTDKINKPLTLPAAKIASHQAVGILKFPNTENI